MGRAKLYWDSKPGRYQSNKCHTTEGESVTFSYRDNIPMTGEDAFGKNFLFYTVDLFRLGYFLLCGARQSTERGGLRKGARITMIHRDNQLFPKQILYRLALAGAHMPVTRLHNC